MLLRSRQLYSDALSAFRPLSVCRKSSVGSVCHIINDIPVETLLLAPREGMQNTGPVTVTSVGNQPSGGCVSKLLIPLS